MPVQTPTTFAAAASNGTGDGGSTRNPAGSGDWSRSRANGSQTFLRRSSQINQVSGSAREASVTAQTPSSAVYVPPHMTSAFARNTSTLDNRYAKDQLLDIYKTRGELTGKDVGSVLTENWVPGLSSAATTSSWGRRDDREINPGPEICWDEDGLTQPLSLAGLTSEEKELFGASVNSLVKPPQPVVKEGAQTPGLNGRKPSVSQGTGSLAGRPGVRRRDTSDSFGGNPLASPTFQRGGRDENPLASPPAPLTRRRTDFKDFGDVGRIDTSVDTKSPFGSLRRTTTNPLSAGLTGPSSPWAAEPQSAGGYGRMGSFGIADQPGIPADKKSGIGSLGSGSRFLKDLRGKESEEAAKSRSLGLLDRLAEESGPPSQRRLQLGNRGQDGADARTGSAALAGDDPTLEQDVTPFHERIQPQSSHHQNQRDTEVTQQLGTNNNFNEPMSPTDTNPYQSPEHERLGVAMEKSHEDDQESIDNPSQGPPQQRRHNVERSDAGSRPGSTAPPRSLAGLGGFGSGFGALGSILPDQKPVSQAGPSRSMFAGEPLFASLGGPGPPGDRERWGPGYEGRSTLGAFGNTERNRMHWTEVNQMQEQMRPQDNRQDLFGGIGASNIPPRNTDSPARSSRNPLEDLFPIQSGNRGPAAMSNPFAGLDTPLNLAGSQLSSAPGFSAPVGTPGITGHPQQWSSGTNLRRSPENDPNQLPPAQQRQMVMPDRMRWVYKDPQGHVQGPFSGLEMHDWYKAGFFSPELLVKKTEDGEYEPLAQLIRRIGNSREPFLVPQIGIAHGSTLGGQGNAGVSAQPTSTAGNIQPPFANSFPSFGTTLTAEQQNALERRKQEEQFLMAQQKEYLQARQQVMRTQMGFSGGPGPSHQGLNHHSSAQSLHSQPSHGSIAGAPLFGGPEQVGALAAHPFGAQRSQAGSYGPVGGMQQVREDELARSFDGLGLGRASQSPFAGFPGDSLSQADPSAVSQMLHDRSQLREQQIEAMRQGQIQHSDTLEGLGRLDQFQQLRQGEAAPPGVIGRPQTRVEQDGGAEELVEESIEHDDEAFQDEQVESDEQHYEQTTRPAMSSMLSRDVTDVQTSVPEDVPPAQSAWASVEKPLTQNLDASDYSTSPLPAPAAQRANQRVIDALATENRSGSQTPSVETPSSSLAPWAKEATDGSLRGPSLKEIQDAEARQAAEREAILAARRREAAEQERIAQAAMPETAPGLPSTASWATSGTPASPGASAWAKPAVGNKATVGPQKKTLAQIQKEEEARKNKAAAVATAAAANNLSTGVMGGKRYAELASKTTQASPVPAAGTGVSGAWTTVGASGKVKTPGSAAPSRSVSGANVPTVAPTAVKKPAPLVRTNTMQTASANANEMVSQWARQSMGRGLNITINPEEFVRNLMTFPLDVEIISDSIYASSSSLDGRRLAEEFVRRRKLADKGITPEGSILSASAGVGSSSAAGSGISNNGGWNEVAKSKPVAKEEPSSSYKVVQNKKKTNKR